MGHPALESGGGERSFVTTNDTPPCHAMKPRVEDGAPDGVEEDGAPAGVEEDG